VPEGRHDRLGPYSALDHQRGKLGDERHDINRRAYLHLVTRLIDNGRPQAQVRDLLPGRVLAAHPELYVGDPALSSAIDPLSLSS
jgi:hypothetical protein